MVITKDFLKQNKDIGDMYCNCAYIKKLFDRCVLEKRTTSYFWKKSAVLIFRKQMKLLCDVLKEREQELELGMDPEDCRYD